MSRPTQTALFLALSLALAGCSAESPNASPSGQDPGGGGANDASPGETGSVGLQLMLPAGQSIEVVQWTITGPNGAPSVVRSGSLKVNESNGARFLVGALPAANNYAVTLYGSATDGSVTCSGSSSFNITPRLTTQISVPFACSVATTGAQVTLVNGMSFNCAAWNNVTANPAETTLGHSVALAATASGPVPGAITYSWSATSGTFDQPNSATPSFTCTSLGTAMVTVTVADGPVPSRAACNAALSSKTIPVQCSASMPDGGTTPDGGAPAVPALPWWAVAGLGASLLGAGRRRLAPRRVSTCPD